MGGRCSGNSRGKTWGLIRLAIRALPHDLVTGGIPHAGSWQMTKFPLHRSIVYSWSVTLSCSLEFSCFFYDPTDVGNLISGSSVFSKTSLNIWKFPVYVVLKPGLENFEHYFTSVWEECNCAVVWAFFGIAFLWDWNENWPFPVLWSLPRFPNLLAYWVRHFHSIIFQDFERAQLEFHHLH